MRSASSTRLVGVSGGTRDSDACAEVGGDAAEAHAAIASVVSATRPRERNERAGMVPQGEGQREIGSKDPLLSLRHPNEHQCRASGRTLTRSAHAENRRTERMRFSDFSLTTPPYACAAPPHSPYFSPTLS